jgi:hypothetical protein
VSTKDRVLTWNIMESLGVDTARVQIVENGADQSAEAYRGISPDRDMCVEFGEYIGEGGEIDGYGASITCGEVPGEEPPIGVYWGESYREVLLIVARVTRGGYGK